MHGRVCLCDMRTVSLQKMEDNARMVKYFFLKKKGVGKAYKLSA